MYQRVFKSEFNEKNIIDSKFEGWIIPSKPKNQVI